MQITKDLVFITQRQVENFFKNKLNQAYDIIKETYLASANCINPPSTFLWYDEETRSRIIGLAAHLGNKKNCPGIKWIASCPENLKKGLPRASALIVLNDFDTGFPIAIIEGATISALRTSLSALLALEHLHKSKELSYLGIVGCGFIAKTFINCVKTLGWQVNHLGLYDTNQKNAATFAQDTPPNMTVHIEKELKYLLQQSNAILFATTEIKPYINDPILFKKNTTLLNISLRDIGTEIVLSGYNIVDDVDHVLAANTAPHLAFLAQGNKNFIAGTLSELILEKIKPKENQLKIFSPMGMGILDIALANLILSDFIQNEQAEVIRNFFES